MSNGRPLVKHGPLRRARVLKHGEPNALSVFGLRRIEHRPPHFTPVYFNLRVNEKQILDWVWEHLEGRFYYGDQYSRRENGQIDTQKCLAFEQAAEASMFALVLDQINHYKNLDF